MLEAHPKPFDFLFSPHNMGQSLDFLLIPDAVD
jgi:hypothetical protein